MIQDHAISEEESFRMEQEQEPANEGIDDDGRAKRTGSLSLSLSFLCFYPCVESEESQIMHVY